MRKAVRKIIDRYGFEDETDAVAVARISNAAAVIQRAIGAYAIRKHAYEERKVSE